MKNISIAVVVYNEEKRIENFIKSFLWSDDIVIIDKSSIDKTVEIAKKYRVKVLSVPYSDTGDEIKYGLEIAKNDWVMTLTASDIIHPKLVNDLLALINKKDFDYDVISIPFAIYVLGIREPNKSPWCAINKEWMYKKSVIKTSKEVHKEMFHNSKKIYKMNYSDDKNLYHLTHETLDSFLERHTRYTKLESEKYNNEKKALKIGLKDLIRACYYVIFKKKSFFKGWDGIALGLAYISYFIFKYLFIWEKFRGNGKENYKEIREKIIKLWEIERMKNNE